MIMRVLVKIFLLVFGLSFTCFAQQDMAENYAARITKADMKENLSILASDALEGRETGSRGQKMAATFISEHFRQCQLTAPVNGSFLQPVNLYAQVPGNIYLKVGDSRFENFKEFVFLGTEDSGGEKTFELGWAGKGEEADYLDNDVRGKAVLIYNEQLAGIDVGGLDVLTGRAIQKGAAMILFTTHFQAEKFERFAAGIQGLLSDPQVRMEKMEPANQGVGVFLVNQMVAEKIAGIPFKSLQKRAAENKKLNFKISELRCQVELISRSKFSENVMGYLEGTDKKDELVIITAHYDHIGKNEGEAGDLINNGADDDGSGTTAVLQLAKVFAEAKREGHGPRRSMLFLTVTGEEIGLYGSEFYTSHPVFPLENTVVDLNIDMIGRRDSNYEGKSDYVYVIGADKLSSELNEINERNNNRHTKLIFDYVYNDELHPDRLYYRSDHWNFAKNNIPIIFYFDGIHEDYHQVSDEVSKIDFDLLVKRTQAVFYTAWEVANRDARLTIDK